MLNLVYDTGWVKKAFNLIANQYLKSVRVVLLNDSEVVGECSVDEAGMTEEGYYVKATFINNTKNQITYNKVGIYDSDGQLIGTISPNLSTIPPYKKVEIDVLLMLM